jgi:hypothetical protein
MASSARVGDQAENPDPAVDARRESASPRGEHGIHHTGIIRKTDVHKCKIHMVGIFLVTDRLFPGRRGLSRQGNTGGRGIRRRAAHEASKLLATANPSPSSDGYCGVNSAALPRPLPAARVLGPIYKSDADGRVLGGG